MELGKKQELTVVKEMDFGFYLNETSDDNEGSVLLPIKQVPNGIGKGDKIEVFLYKDSKDRLIATTNEPDIMIGEFKLLKVKENTKIGAFLDWGLEKDLLLPYKEQTALVKEGRSYLVTPYVDKSERLCATMHLYKYLSKESPYNVDDKVEGVIYEISKTYGAYVAVDNKYCAGIALKEIHKDLRVGDSITARVARVLDDGKLDLSLSEKAHIQMDSDAELILETIESYDGILPFNDKAKPEIIEREFSISKNAFKRAVGRLLKQGKIEIGENCIKLK